MNELDSNDRYHLKKVQMDVDRKNLEAQRAQQELDRLILDLEHKYELIGNEKNSNECWKVFQHLDLGSKVPLGHENPEFQIR